MCYSREKFNSAPSRFLFIEEHDVFELKRFVFVRRKSEKSSSVVRDDSFTNIAHQANASSASKRLASAPPENVPLSSQRRSRADATATINSHEQHSAKREHDSSSKVDHVVNLNGPVPSSNQNKHRFFSLSRRFRFRTQSPETAPHSETTVHFLDQDIDLETKEPTTRKSDQHSNKPSKGILKTLRHRSPFRFRSKDAVIAEQEPSPPPPLPPPPPPPAPAPTSKEVKSKNPPAATKKTRGRLVELKKPTTTNGTNKKSVNVTAINEPTAGSSSLVRRASGLKDLIHKFEATPPKPKRTNQETNESNVTSVDETQVQPEILSKLIDIPDLLQNVEKDSNSNFSKPTLRHSNSARQTASFDSTSSMISATESITTTASGTNARKPTSTARPLMLSVVSDRSNRFCHFNTVCLFF